MKFLRFENIPPRQLLPNRKNPRSDLGDLSELIESIRENGIYQELTVVPQGEVSIYNPEDGSTTWKPSYTVVIGHRRLAAAKKAGLETVPCKVVEMSAKEMQTTMLTENVQRSDLTPLEEAKGIQMCLDLGIPENEISQKAGMSKSKIRTRKYLLQYDSKFVSDSFAKGMTIQDYIDAQKIEDAETRENLVRKYGATSNFRFELNKAYEAQQREKCLAVLIRKLKPYAEPIPEGVSEWEYSYAGEFRLSDPSAAEKIDVDAEMKKMLKYKAPDDKVYYSVNYWNIVIRLEEAAVADKKSVRKKEEQEVKDCMTALDKDIMAARNCRAEFVKGLKEYLPQNQHIAKRKAFVYIIDLLSKYWPGLSINASIAEILFYKGWKLDEEGLEEIGKIYDSRPVYALLLVEYLIREHRHGRGNLYNWKAEYSEPAGDDLRQLYEWLAKFNYRISETERQLITGRHPKYRKPEAEQNA